MINSNSSRSKRSNSSKIFHRHNSTTIPLSFTTAKSKFTNYVNDKPRRNSCLTKSLKSKSVKSLSKYQQALSNFHHGARESKANINITNFSKLKKVNENLNQVLCMMKKEISYPNDRPTSDNPKNFSTFLNNSSVDNNTYEDSKVNPNISSGQTRKLDPDKLFEDINFEEPEISSDEEHEDKKSKEGNMTDKKEENDNKNNPFGNIKLAYNGLTLEEQITLATFIKDDSIISLHLIMEELLKVKKENAELKAKNNNIEEEVKVSNQEKEKLNQSISEMKTNLELKNETIKINQEKYETEISKLKEKNKKIEIENKYLKEKLAKTIFTQQMYSRAVVSNLEDINKMQQKLKNEFLST